VIQTCFILKLWYFVWDEIGSTFFDSYNRISGTLFVLCLKFDKEGKKFISSSLFLNAVFTLFAVIEA
jgi:hypothetical protein